MKNDRLFAIVNHLLTRGRTGARQLAERFEVSERTIYRDMDSLSGNGVPVIAVPGAGGGFEIEEGFRIDRSFLTGEELADLKGALGGFTEALKSRPLERSLAKLEGLGPRSRATGNDRARRGNAERVPAARGASPAPALLVTLTPWGGRSAESRVVEQLRDAVAERSLVSLLYRDHRGVVTERVVEPFSVVLGGAVWYLHAWCRLRDAFRLFRISRVVEATTLEERFDPWLRAPVPGPFVLTPEEDLVEVLLEVGASRLPGLTEALDDAVVTPAAGGSARVSFRCPAGEWLESYVLSLGPGVAVVEPRELRETLTRGDRVPGASSPAKEDVMTEMMTAQCGLDCSKCPARIAFLEDDPELRRRTAKEWSEKYNVSVKPEDVFCSGCRVEGEPKICHCNVCEVRRCGRERGVANCGECSDYSTCPTIAGFIQYIPDARATLDAIHARATGH
jgi:predicted DNA-binding transcriptional regulator YafY